MVTRRGSIPRDPTNNIIRTIILKIWHCLFCSNSKNDYFILIFEHVNDNHFIERATALKENLNLSFNTITQSTKDLFVFTKYSPNENLILNTYNKLGITSYYWIDPFSRKLIKKTTIASRFDDKKGKTGMIGLGYNIENLTDKDDLKYGIILNKTILIFASLLSLFISILLYIIGNKLKAIIFMVIINIYILYFINIYEGITSPENELDKINNISEGILSISFLFAVNVYILKTIKQKKGYNNLFKETAGLFTIALILLIFSLFRIDNYQNILELILKALNFHQHNLLN